MIYLNPEQPYSQSADVLPCLLTAPVPCSLRWLTFPNTFRVIKLECLPLEYFMELPYLKSHCWAYSVIMDHSSTLSYFFPSHRVRWANNVLLHLMLGSSRMLVCFKRIWVNHQNRTRSLLVLEMSRSQQAGLQNAKRLERVAWLGSWFSIGERKDFRHESKMNIIMEVFYKFSKFK